MATAEQILNKYVSNSTAAANGSYIDGVMGVREAPTLKAAANEAGWIAGCQRAQTEGKFKRGCERVDLASWQASVKNKGVSNYTTGVTASKQKMLRHIQMSIPVWASIKEQVRAMPKGSLEDGINRVRKAAQMMIDAYK